LGVQNQEHSCEFPVKIKEQSLLKPVGLLLWHSSCYLILKKKQERYMRMNSSKKLFYGWWIVAVCMLIMGTIFCLRINLMGLFVVTVTKDLGITRSQFSVISTIAALIGMVLSPYAGKLLGRKNLRYLMAAATAVCTLSYASLGLAQNVWHLYISAAGMGLSFVFLAQIPVSILVNRWFVKSRSMAMSIALAGVNIGAMILSPLVTGLISSQGWRRAYLILGVAMCVLLVPLILLIVRSNPEEMGLTALGAGEESQKKAGAQKEGKPLKELQRTSEFWMILGGLTLIVLTVGCLHHMPAHATDIGFAAEQVAMFVSIYSLTGLFGKFILGAVYDRMGLKAGTFLAMGCMTLTFVFLLIARSFPLLICAGLCYGIGGSVGTLLPPVIVGKTYSGKYYGETIGFFNAFVSLAMAINNPMFATAYDITGTYSVAWIVSFVVGVLAIIMMMTGINRRLAAQD